jgi:hypothetical protein
MEHALCSFEFLFNTVVEHRIYHVSTATIRIAKNALQEIPLPLAGGRRKSILQSICEPRTLHLYPSIISVKFEHMLQVSISPLYFCFLDQILE